MRNYKYKYTIVIPLYNQEKFIIKCLDSINNSKNNLEIIIIDDNSSDNSYNIVLNYSKNINNINIYRNKKKGVSSARNMGIELAHGEYITFIDSDDIVEDNYFEVLDKVAQKKALGIFGYYEYYKNGKIKKSYKTNVENNISIFFKKYCNGFIWNKIYDLDVINENKILFNENVNYLEDLLFNLDYIKYVKNVNYLEDAVYCYRMVKSSITNSIKIDIGPIKVLYNIILLYNIIEAKILFLRFFKKYKYIDNKNIDLIKYESFYNKIYREVIKNSCFKIKVKVFFICKFYRLYKILLKIKKNKHIFFD